MFFVKKVTILIITKFVNIYIYKILKSVIRNSSYIHYISLYLIIKNIPDYNLNLELGCSVFLLFVLNLIIQNVTQVAHEDNVNIRHQGASILRMIASFMGQEKFQAGIEFYLKKYTFKNSETDDLWNAFSLQVQFNIYSLNFTHITYI